MRRALRIILILLTGTSLLVISPVAGESESAEINSNTVIRWGASAAAIALVVLVGIVAWNRRLSREIVKRKSITDSLQRETEFSQAVLRWIHSIVVVADARGHMLVFNNAAEECSGYCFNEIQGRPFWEILILPEEMETVKEGTDKVLSDRSTTSSLNYWVTKNGNKRLIQWRNSPLMTPDGNVGYVLCTGLDITERQRAEKASAEIQEKLTHALNATGASIWEWNLKTNEIDIGNEIIHHLGYQKKELILTPEGMTEIVDDKSAALFAGLMERHREDDQQTCIIEVKIRSKKGDWHWLRSQTRVYRWDKDNQPELLLGSLLDITDSKRTQEMMIQTEKMLSVGGLAAGMAHELNNPLGAILMGLQNIARRLDPGVEKNRTIADKHGIDLITLQQYLNEQKVLTSIEGIQEAGIRAAGIISNMLQFSRASNSAFEPVALTDLIDKTLQLAENDFDLKKRMDFKQITVSKAYDDTLPPVSCTANEIRQVLLNIIINAFQAMADDENEPQKHLIISTRRDDPYAVIEIQDNGPGMNSEVRKRIFEPFYTTKPVGYGTGLGLSVAYMIITNNHNGAVEVNSIPSEGTRFTIRLPLTQDAGS